MNVPLIDAVISDATTRANDLLAVGPISRTVTTGAGQP